MFFLDTILQVPKIKYVFNLFLPFAFICFFSPELLLPSVPASHLLANHLAKRRIIYYNRDPEIRFLPFEYYVIVKTGRNGDEPEEFSEESIQFFKDDCKAIFQKDRILVLRRKTPPMSLEEYRKKMKNGL